MKTTILLLFSFVALNSWAAGSTSTKAQPDLTQDMDALGANEDLMRQARAVDPHNRIRVVQNREVDRNMRLELGLNYGTVAGGDAYVETNNLGAQLDFHFTPRFSLGARYYNSSNSLNTEGHRVFDDAQARRARGENNRFPGVDYVKDTWLAIANWYPIYGKLNLLDMGVAQFDIYLLGGAGEVSLASGNAPTYTAGGGVGFWLTQHISTRLEARWQGYQDHTYDGSSQVNLTILTATVGFLF